MTPTSRSPSSRLPSPPFAQHRLTPRARPSSPSSRLKQLDINVDPSISVQGNFSYGQLSVNLHNAADAAFHDDLAGSGGAASGSGGGGAYQPRFTTFTHGAHLGQLPVPRLRFLFHLELELDAQRDVGDGPFGKRTTAGVSPLPPRVTPRSTSPFSAADDLPSRAPSPRRSRAGCLRVRPCEEPSCACPVPSSALRMRSLCPS